MQVNYTTDHLEDLIYRLNKTMFDILRVFRDCILGRSVHIMEGDRKDLRIQYFRQICMYLSARYGSQSNLEARLTALEDELKVHRTTNAMLVERIKQLEAKTGEIYPEYDFSSMKETKHVLHAELRVYYKLYAKMRAIAK